MNPRWPVFVVGALLVAPLVATLWWLHGNDRWAPLFDLAMTELPVRDVGTVHTPLVGLPGRLGAAGNGSHPGPLAFYLLAPVYRCLGGSYFALRVSNAVLDAGALFTALFIARRRGGTAARRPCSRWASRWPFSSSGTGCSCSRSPGTRTCRCSGSSRSADSPSKRGGVTSNGDALTYPSMA